MTRRELSKITAQLLKHLVESGYTQKDSGDTIIACAKLIQEVRNEKSKETSREENSGIRVYNERLSDL